MNIINPSVELWHVENWKDHVAKCARICYRSENKTNNDKLIDNLLASKHLSMFRHRSVYYIVPIIKIGELMDVWGAVTFLLSNNVYVRYRVSEDKYYIATNGHFYLDHINALSPLDAYIVDDLTFINTEIGHKIARYTFKVVTQISTSRELNRVSPNNISEQSTRYVYEDGTLCKPWWIDKVSENAQIAMSTVYKATKKEINSTETILAKYLNSCEDSFNNYKHLVEKGMNRQDARGVLPLDTATVCAYTYFIDEWMHIIDLRYYGTTGKPHPNAKIIAGEIRNYLRDEGYEFI